MYKYNMRFETWLDGITKNLPLAILLVMVPVLSIPLKLGRYLQAFNYYVSKYLNRTCSLFFVLSSFVFTMGAITNLGGIRVANDLVEEVEFPSEFLAKVYTVGFTPLATWTPYFGAVNLIIYYTGVSYDRYVFFGLLLGICILLLGNLIFYKDLECQNEVRATIKAVEKITNDSAKVKKLALVLIGLFIVVIIGEKTVHLSSMMLLVSLIAVIYAVFWSVYINKFKEFLQQIKSYDENILRVKNEVVFFLSVGFFGVVLANTPVRYVIENFLQGISTFSTFFLVEFIIVITALLSSVGFHQVVTVTALGLSIEPSIIGLNDITFALTLLSAWTVSMIFSPFVPYNILVGGLLKENTFTLGFKWNRTFGIVVTIFSGLYIALVNMIL